MSTAPVPGTDTIESEDDTFQRVALVRIARGLAIITFLMAAAAALGGEFARTPAPLLVGMVGMTALPLARRGHVDAGSWLITAVWFVATTVGMFRFGGVADPIADAQLIAVVLAGILLGRRGGLLTAAAVAIAIAAAIALEANGTIVRDDPLSAELAGLLRLVVLVVIAASLFVYAQERARAAEASERARADRQALGDYYETLLGSAPMIVSILDLELGRREYISPEYERVTGLSLADHEALSVEDQLAQIHPDDLAGVGAAWDLFLATTGAEGTETVYRLRTVEGWRWYSTSSRVLSVDAAGRPAKVLTTAIDTTEQVETQDEYAAILEAAPVDISVLDMPSGARDTDASYSRIGELGERQRDFAVPDVDARIHPDDLPLVRRRWAEFAASGGAEGTEVTFRIDGDGDGGPGWHWFTTRARPTVVDADGSIQRALVVAVDVTAEREAEASRLAGFDDSLALVTIYDLTDYRLEYANQAFVATTGYTLDRFAALSREDALGLYGDTGDAFVASVGRARETGEPQDERLTMTTADGDRRIFESRISYLEGTDNPPRPKLLVSSIDLTDLIRADAYRTAVLDSSPAGISVYDLTDGRPEFINAEFAALTGYDLESFRGLTPSALQHIIPADDLQDLTAASIDAFENNRTREVRHRVRHADDDLAWYESRITRFVQGDGVPRILVSSIAVSAQMEAETLAETILDANPNIVLVWDPDTMVAEFANPAFSNLTGFTVDDLNDLDRADIPSLVHPDDQQAEEEAIDRALATGNPVFLTHRIRRHDGTWRWFETWYRSFPDIHGTKPRRVLVNSTDVTARIELQGLYDTVINESPVTFLVYDYEARRYEWVNPAFIDITGFDVDELNRRAEAHPDGPIITHADDLEAEAAAMQTTLATGEPTEVRHRMICADGASRWFDSKFIRLVDEADPTAATGRVLMSSLDVTERVESEQFNETILDSSPSMTLVFNADPDDTHTLFVNRKYTDYTGMTLADVHALTTAERRALTPDEDRPAVNEAIARARAGEMAIVRRRHLDRHGELRWLDTRFVPMPDPTGLWPYRTLVTSVDITDQLSAEQMNETVLRSSPALTVVFDTDTGKTTFASSSFTEATGYTVDDLNAMPRTEMEALTPGANLSSVRFAIDAALETGDVQVIEHPYRHADGAIRWYDGRFVRLPEEGSTELLITMTDVTDRRVAEEALEAERQRLLRANRDLEGFVYIASHDLQEPLRTVSAFAALLESELSESLTEDIATYLRYISGGTTRMRDLISDLLELARIGQEHAVSRVDVGEVLAELRTDLTDLVEREGATLEVDDLPTIDADPAGLRLVFRNLLSNALKFRDADRDPFVRVTAEPTDNGWRFEVTDNGIGIADRHLERIFHVFHRLNPRSEYEGTGIGLAHCQRAVDNHGGEIGVESEVGVGSTFWFTIPHTDQTT